MGNGNLGNIRPKADACSGPDCCPTEPAAPASSAPTNADGDSVRDRVREGYGEIARTGQWSGVTAQPVLPDLSVLAVLPVLPVDSNAAATEGAACAPGGGCCGPVTLTADQVASAIGYTTNDLATIPAGANLGLSCGNPTAIASLREGERVLDLGSGGGLDCFLAGRAVGAAGRVIGVDMTPDMISRARRNLGAYRDSTKLDNVEFRLGEIEHLPVADASVDVLISNCVLNLSPEKEKVWRDIARVVAPGGRIAVSDVALFRPLPEAVRSNVEALVGCIAGAALVADIERSMKDAGLVDIVLTPKPEYVAAMCDAADPLYRSIQAALPAGTTVADFVTSLDIRARKP